MISLVLLQSSLGRLIEPEPVGYSFNTPGWYIVLGLLMLAVLVYAIIRYREYRKNAYRRAAVAQIESMDGSKKDTAVYEINRLLKIIAIKVFGRNEVASLYGTDWFDFLEATMPQKKGGRNNNIEKFAMVIYDKNYVLQDKEYADFIEFATLWVKKHEIKNV